MPTQANRRAKDHFERRRSERVAVRVTIVVCGDRNGPFQEEASTLFLNAHGALVALQNQVVAGQKLTLQNPQNWAERVGQVTRLGASHAGRTEVGIEFTEPDPDFWLPLRVKRARPD